MHSNGELLIFQGHDSRIDPIKTGHSGRIPYSSPVTSCLIFRVPLQRLTVQAEMEECTLSGLSKTCLSKEVSFKPHFSLSGPISCAPCSEVSPEPVLSLQCRMRDSDESKHKS